jgi:choline kinase
MSAVQGLILAAGRGSRLRALTSTRPKALVPICGKPLIEWQLLALRSAGVTNITAVGGYRAAALGAYLPVLVNERWSATNMVYSLLQFTNTEGTDVIVSYSDIIYSNSAVEALLSDKNDLAVTYDVNWSSLWSARFTDPLADAESFRANEGLVVDLGRKVSSAAEIAGQYMGLVKFSRQGWADCVDFARQLPPSVVDVLDMTGFLRRLMEAGRTVGAVAYDAPWGEVDSAHDLTLYEQDSRFAGLRTMLEELATCRP